MTVTVKCSSHGAYGSDGKKCEVFDSKAQQGCLIHASSGENSEGKQFLSIDVHRCDKGVRKQGEFVEKDE